MGIFTGHYERTIDSKNRIQLPSPLRAAIDPARDGRGLYVNLGDHPGTLSLFTERGFEELADRLETEFIPGPESLLVELQFFGLASYVDMDKQGRIVLPEKLLAKARLGSEVILVGQKSRIDIWNSAALDRSMAIDWDGEEWVKWHSFLRKRPTIPK